jgi:hypothetical protein
MTMPRPFMNLAILFLVVVLQFADFTGTDLQLATI